MQVPPLALYVHLPWCVRKCPYCDFNSHALTGDLPGERYVDALLRDLQQQAERFGGRVLSSVFLGGGTPSLFTPAQIERLLTGIDAAFPLAKDAEITLEANPGTVEYGDPAGYRQAGVNRLSIGAQSFNAEQLRALGRIHSAADTANAVAAAQRAGIENINIDVMYGLPGQTVAASSADLQAAVELAPQHISWYQLTLEPNTVFFARPPQGLPDNDLAYEIQRAGQQQLAEQGFAQYEISAYARRPKLRSVHNLNYWSFGDYLAIGAGAHGKITAAGAIYRYRQTANPLGYMQLQEQGGAASLEPVPADQWLFEFLLNALRLTDGFAATLAAERLGITVTELESRFAVSVAKGLLERQDCGNWRATELGQRFLNDLQAEFLP